METVAGETPLSSATSRKVTVRLLVLRRVKTDSGGGQLRMNDWPWTNIFIIAASARPEAAQSGEFLDVRNLGDVPAASEGFDQQDAGGHATGQQIHGGHFVGKRRAVRGGPPLPEKRSRSWRGTDPRIDRKSPAPAPRCLCAFRRRTKFGWLDRRVNTNRTVPESGW